MTKNRYQYHCKICNSKLFSSSKKVGLYECNKCFNYRLVLGLEKCTNNQLIFNYHFIYHKFEVYEIEDYYVYVDYFFKLIQINDIRINYFKYKASSVNETFSLETIYKMIKDHKLLLNIS